MWYCLNSECIYVYLGSMHPWWLDGWSRTAHEKQLPINRNTSKNEKILGISEPSAESFLWVLVYF